MQSVALQAEGVTRGDEREEVEKDLHCPQMPGFLNYWMKICLERQKLGGGCRGIDCPSGKQVKGMLERKYVKSYSFRTSDELKCKCGAPALAEDLMEKWGVEEPRCIRCNRMVRLEQKRRRARESYRRNHGCKSSK